ncbi:hypothetical protein DL769_008342 [Monosporascus sp. CRB-8-3]|nr:hypothetical protein DL769_008342 [Monosporascus sp. CRB-8-3]
MLFNISYAPVDNNTCSTKALGPCRHQPTPASRVEAFGLLDVHDLAGLIAVREMPRGFGRCRIARLHRLNCNGWANDSPLAGIGAGANRNDTLADAVRKTWARAGVRGFYQGLIPWAWLEASTKGAILILTSTEVEYYSKYYFCVSDSIAGVLGGIVGGASQAYLTMGMTTCMKTVEVTRMKKARAGAEVVGTMQTFFEILRTKGVRGINRGVNAVALRQITGWSSRIGISRFAEGNVRRITGKEEKGKLSLGEKIASSTFGGALSCWNQPFEVVRIEMQSLKADPSRPESPTMMNTAKHILRTSGPTGFFRVKDTFSPPPN